MPIQRRNSLRNHRDAAHPYINRTHFNPTHEPPRGWMNEELSLGLAERYSQVKQHMLDLLNGQSRIFKSIARHGAFKNGQLPTSATSVAIIRGFLLDCERDRELMHRQRRNLARMASEAYHAMIEGHNMPTNAFHAFEHLRDGTESQFEHDVMHGILAGPPQLLELLQSVRLLARHVQQRPATVLDRIMRNRQELNGHRFSPFGQPIVLQKNFAASVPTDSEPIWNDLFANMPVPPPDSDYASTTELQLVAAASSIPALPPAAASSSIPDSQLALPSSASFEQSELLLAIAAPPSSASQETSPTSPTESLTAQAASESPAASAALESEMASEPTERLSTRDYVQRQFELAFQRHQERLALENETASESSESVTPTSDGSQSPTSTESPTTPADTLAYVQRRFELAFQENQRNRSASESQPPVSAERLATRAATVAYVQRQFELAFENQRNRSSSESVTPASSDSQMSTSSSGSQITSVYNPLYVERQMAAATLESQLDSPASAREVAAASAESQNAAASTETQLARVENQLTRAVPDNNAAREFRGSQVARSFTDGSMSRAFTGSQLGRFFSDSDYNTVRERPSATNLIVTFGRFEESESSAESVSSAEPASSEDSAASEYSETEVSSDTTEEREEPRTNVSIEAIVIVRQVESDILSDQE
ncbi:hypothetical protein KR093_004260 [Drosophila rubida]|uniref:Uncharacterized protein n=1 Tax=Drosophila rubida TaxID=30044 RepID=A0AAD4KA23_9MUSC|nr:hypothetical protein KR093_004260 [Drosophila rubida]